MKYAKTQDALDKLTPEQFRVTQQSGTERPGTGVLTSNTDRGIYVDIVSGEPLFSSKDKFKSGTGWPSFMSTAGKDAVSEHEDRSLFARRTEVRCVSCEAHIGHVFPDGPQPTGLRYCINGTALAFDAKDD